MKKTYNGKKIKELRNFLKLNQADFGTRIGLNQTQIKNIETDWTKLSPSIAKLVCLEFGVNMDWLLTGEGEMFGGERQGELQVISTNRRESKVCGNCGQAFGLGEQVQAKQEALDLAKEAIQDKQELLKMKEETLQFKEAEIGRLQKEMAVLEQFKQDRSA